MKKGIIAALLLPIGIVLGALVSPVTDNWKRWTLKNPSSAFYLAAGLLLTSMFLVFLKENSEAKQTGEPISLNRILGSILALAATWACVGASIGWLIDYEFSAITSFFDRFQNGQWKFFSAFLHNIGPAGASCILVGAMAGTGLGYAYPSEGSFLTFLGVIFGGIIGNTTRNYFLQTESMPAFSTLGASGAAGAAALLGGSLGGLTGIFRPGYERWKREQKRPSLEKICHKSIDLPRLERAIKEIRSLDHTVIWGSYVDMPLVGAFINHIDKEFRELRNDPKYWEYRLLFFNFITSLEPMKLPCIVQDPKGTEISKFETIEVLEDFAKSLRKLKTINIDSSISNQL